jgi:hypothetical protein
MQHDMPHPLSQHPAFHNGSKGTTTIPIDWNTVMDVFYMIEARPELQLPLNAISSLFLETVPTIRIKEWNLVISDEFKSIARETYIPAYKSFYIWYQAVGVIPYVWERLRDTDTFYPRALCYTTGVIHVVQHEKGKTSFIWKWNNGTWDKDVRFQMTPHPPRWDGSIQAPLVSLLGLHRRLVVAELAFHSAVPNTANPVYFYEQDEKEVDLGQHNETLATYGYDMAAQALQAEAALNEIGSTRSQQAVKAALLHAADNNIGRIASTRTSTQGELLSQASINFIDRAVPLAPGWRLKNGPTPRLIAPTKEMYEELAHASAALLGIPQEFIKPGSAGGTASHHRGVNQLFKEHVKAHARIFSGFWATSTAELAGPFLLSVSGVNVKKMVAQRADDGKTVIIDKETGDVMGNAGAVIKRRKAKRKRMRENREGKKEDTGDDEPVADDSYDDGESDEEVLLQRANKKKRKLKKERDSKKPASRPRHRKKPATPSTRDTFFFNHFLTIEVEYTVTPVASAQQIRQLRLDNVLSQKQYRDLATRNAGITIDEYETPDDALLLEERSFAIQEKAFEANQKAGRLAAKQGGISIKKPTTGDMAAEAETEARSDAQQDKAEM